MSLTSLTQAQRVELGALPVKYLVDWTLGSTTLHLSDTDFRYTYGLTTINYESYIKGISGLGEAVSINGQPSNSDVTIELFNEPWSTYSNLSKFGASEEFNRSAIVVYELRQYGDETFASDVRTCHGKYVVEEVFDITEMTFKLKCSSRLFDKRNAWGGDKITSSLYTYADPNDIGKIRNTLYGTLEKVPCRCVYTGGIDTLPADITAAQTSITLSGVAQMPFQSSGSFQIDDEICTYTSFNASTYTLSGISRGTGGTTATIHKKGAAVCQIRTSYVYEISRHPINSIDAVFVDDVKQVMYPTSGSVCRAYTGQPGDELSGYASRAVVSFQANPIVKKQINVSVTSEHTHSTNTGSHAHTAPPSNIVLFPTSAGATVSYSGYASVTDPSFSIDGNDASYANCYLNSSASSLDWAGVNIGFPSTSYGTIQQVNLWVKLRSISSNTRIDIGYNGATVASFGGSSLVGEGWYRVVLTSNLAWGAGCSAVIRKPSGTTAQGYVYDMRLEVYYQAPTTSSGATGVSTSISGATVVQGLSSADIVIGDEVTVDCTGFRDDSYGTITGAPNTLIARPDHCIKHFLVNLCGLPSTDIGTSFSTSGATFSSLSFALAFIVHDLATDAQQVVAILARNCRSQFCERYGKFELQYLPDAAPSPDFTVESDDIKELPKFRTAPTWGTANRISAYYRPDWRSKRANGDVLPAGVRADALAAGYMDVLVSTYGAADIDGQLILRACRLSAMAANLLAFEVARLSVPRTYVELAITWRGIQVAQGQYFSLTNNLTGTNTYRITSYQQIMERDTIRIIGEKV